MNMKTKQLAAALGDAPLPKPWWKTVEVDYYFDWRSWGIVVEFATTFRGRGIVGLRQRGFLFQIGPWGMAFRWPKSGLAGNPSQGQEASAVVGGVNMQAVGFNAPPQGMTPMQAALSARTRGSNNKP